MTTSIGFSLIFGVAKQFKLSLGGYYVIGAYTMFFFQNSLLIPVAFPTDNVIQSIFLLLLYFLPFIVTGIVLVLVYVYFGGSQSLKLIFIIAPIISLIGISALSGSLPYGFFSGLAIACLGLMGWYLEFDKRSIVFIILIISILNPIAYILILWL